MLSTPFRSLETRSVNQLGILPLGGVLMTSLTRSLETRSVDQLGILPLGGVLMTSLTGNHWATGTLSLVRKTSQSYISG